ncbi:MAG: rod shape-determining protein MreC [Eubacteriales bacterium]
MKDFFNKNTGILLIISVLLTLIIAGGSVIMSGSVDPISNAIGVVATPFRNLTATITNWGEEFYDFLIHYEEMEHKVEELEIQVAEMEEELRIGSDAIRQNELLRELLNLQGRRRDFVFESAKVTSRSFASWESRITLDKGESAGLAVDQCVVTETGHLVGVITQVGENFSVLSTVVSTDISMGAMVSRTNSPGVLEGEFSLMNQGLISLGYLPEEAQLVAGDQVVTSGMGNIYPSGLMVGRIISVEQEPSGLSRYAVVEPEVDLNELYEVFVIKDFDIID